MTLKQQSAVEVLNTAHERIRTLLDKYESNMKAADKEKLLADLSFELSVLDVLESEVFYPAIHDVEGVSTEEFMENHSQIKVLTAQAQRLMGDESEFDSHVKQLGDMVKKHINSENEKLFPLLEKSSVDLESLGEGLNKKREDVTGKVVF